MRCFAVALAASAFALPGLPAQEAGGSDAGGTIKLPGVRQLTITGELRWRWEKRDNYDFLDDAGSNPSFIGQRARVAFDFDVNEDLRVFLQIADVRNFGEESTTTDGSADAFDLHQGFLDWNDFAGGDGSLRLGRQEVAIGDQRLVSSLNWANTGRVLDGAVFSTEIEGEWDLLVFGLVADDDVSLTDHQGAYFLGLDLEGDVTDRWEAAVYLYTLLDEETTAGGTENRSSLGLRANGSCGVGIDGDLHVVTQFGEKDRVDIPFGETYALHVGGGYTFHDSAYAPRISAEYNMASGNDPNSSDNERFNNLFPFAHAYLGYMDFALWENIEHFSVSISAKPLVRSKVGLAWHNFTSSEPTDSFGGPVGSLSSGGAGFRANMGDEFDLTWKQTYTQGVWGLFGFSAFLPGNGVLDAKGSDDTALFAYYMMGLKF